MKIIIDKFIKYLLIEKRYSDKTVDNYTIDLYLFLDFLGKNDIRKFSNVSYDLLRKYLEFLCDKNYSNKTISRHISSLKSFYKYLINNNIIESNPTELLSLPKAEFRLPNYLTTIELIILWIFLMSVSIIIDKSLPFPKFYYIYKFKHTSNYNNVVIANKYLLERIDLL